MGFLRFDRHGRNRSGDQATQADGIAGDFAVAVFPGIDPPERRVDLGDQLALPVAGAQFDAPVGLARSAIGQIGFADRPVLERLQCLSGGRVDRAFP